MSQLYPAVVTCPRCAAAVDAALYSSLDADTIPVEVAAVLDGTFEARTCACGHAFRPEHPMLFASHARRLWVVMHPPADRRGYATLEAAVATIIAQQIDAAAPVAAERLRGLRPRLVFGQHMLTEAVRAAWAGVDASLLECAKLLAVRRQLDALVRHGPFELCFERFDGARPICAVHTLPDGARVDELALPADALGEASAARADLQARFPELFGRPYVSATRYLIGTTA